MMKRHLFIFSLLAIGFAAFAQEEEPKEKKGFQKENLFIGGNFGLTFGDYTLVNISPQLGYHFNKTIAAGIGINAQYISYKQRDLYTSDPFYKSSRGVGGLNVFGRVYPIRNIMLQVQPELNYIFGKEIYFDPPPKQVYNLNAMIVPSMLLGGGAVFPAGKGALIASIFYDVLQKENNPYGKRPVYNFGYNIGF
jgi:hypothetical protein